MYDVTVGLTNSKVQIWHVESAELVSTLSGHTATVRSVAFGNDDILASFDDSYLIFLWNSSTGELLTNYSRFANMLITPSCPTPIECVPMGPFLKELAFSSSRRHLAAASGNVFAGYVFIWDVYTGVLWYQHLFSVRAVSVQWNPTGFDFFYVNSVFRVTHLNPPISPISMITNNIILLF